MKQNKNKFKIELILRDSCQSPKKINKRSIQSSSNLSKQNTNNKVIETVRAFDNQFQQSQKDHISPIPSNQQKIIESKKQIGSVINQCFGPPLSQKERRNRVFTQRCLQLLAKKKLKNSQKSPQKQKPQSFDKMMTQIILNLKQQKQKKRRQQQNKNISSNGQQLMNSISYKKTINMFQDKVELYRLLKSTQIIQPINIVKPQLIIFKNMRKFNKNNRKNNIDGVRCTSLPLSQQHNAKKNVPIIPQTQSRPVSSHQIRKVAINSHNSSSRFQAIKHLDQGDYSYSKRLRSYLDFLFKINYSNKIYVSLKLATSLPSSTQPTYAPIFKYKAYVGPGNNCLLIRSLLKRRFWIQQVSNIDQENLIFCWTQNKINKLHQKQNNRIKQWVKPAIMGGGKVKYCTRKVNELKTDVYKHNAKIMVGDDIISVEQCIIEQGYTIPFSGTYRACLITNHLPGNSMIGSKKKLFASLVQYYRFLKKDPFDYIPKTYHVNGYEDPQFTKFESQNLSQHRIWIIKPGQQTNRGTGIKLSKLQNLKQILVPNQKHQNGHPVTYIIQSYISQPFLYNHRKFDIRHYMLLTSVNGYLKAYWYRQGYIRTSSQIFTLQNLQNIYIHLTNDAIQRNNQHFGQYEPANKISYNEFQRYLDYNFRGYYLQNILEQMKIIMIDVVKANYKVIDPRRKQCNFQIFGFDFMIDKDFKVWLIQINFNPCLEINCPLLGRIIPNMVQNALRIGLDPLAPPRNHYPRNYRYHLSDNHLKNLKYQLIFDEAAIIQPYVISIPTINQSDSQPNQEYQDDGNEVNDILI